MTDPSRADVVLVRFTFSDESGARRRPVVIISSDAYHRGRQEAVVAAITSNVERQLLGDHLIANWRGAGLILPSVATGIIRTIKQTMIERRLGVMPAEDMQAIEKQLRKVLAL